MLSMYASSGLISHCYVGFVFHSSSSCCIIRLLPTIHSSLTHTCRWSTFSFSNTLHNICKYIFQGITSHRKPPFCTATLGVRSEEDKGEQEDVSVTSLMSQCSDDVCYRCTSPPSHSSHSLDGENACKTGIRLLTFHESCIFRNASLYLLQGTSYCLSFYYLDKVMGRQPRDVCSVFQYRCLAAIYCCCQWWQHLLFSPFTFLQQATLLLMIIVMYASRRNTAPPLCDLSFYQYICSK